MPIALAVYTSLYTIALDCAPLTLSRNSQFFLPTTEDRIAFSARLLEMGTLLCFRKTFSCSWFREYRIASSDLLPFSDSVYFVRKNTSPELVKLHSGGILFGISAAYFCRSFFGEQLIAVLKANHCFAGFYGSPIRHGFPPCPFRMGPLAAMCNASHLVVSHLPFINILVYSAYFKYSCFPI